MRQKFGGSVPGKKTVGGATELSPPIILYAFPLSLSCYFTLGCEQVVSKASAGALEFAPVFNTRNMPRFLAQSAENGWRVVGTSLGESSIPLSELETGIPTILVLGNEGAGLRTMVERACSTLVIIEKATAADGSATGGSGRGRGSGVDSLNVAVSGGIVMHHLLS